MKDNLCYLYCRATRCISVVPPLYYAHLVAIRARYHISAVHGHVTNQAGDQLIDGDSQCDHELRNELNYSPSKDSLKQELQNTMYFM